MSEQGGVVLSVGLARAVAGPQHLRDGCLSPAASNAAHTGSRRREHPGRTRRSRWRVVEGVDGFDEGVLRGCRHGSTGQAIPAPATRVISSSSWSPSSQLCPGQVVEIVSTPQAILGSRLGVPAGVHQETCLALLAVCYADSQPGSSLRAMTFDQGNVALNDDRRRHVARPSSRTSIGCPCRGPRDLSRISSPDHDIPPYPRRTL